MHSKEDVLSVAHGRIVEGLDIDVSKPIDSMVALKSALLEQKLTSEHFDKDELPKGELLLARKDENFLKESYRLAYRFNLQGERITKPYQVFVDAQTGEVFKKISLVQNCFRVETGSGAYPLRNIPNTGSAYLPFVTSTLIPNYPRYLNFFRYPDGETNITFETESVGSQFRLSAFGNKLNTRIDRNQTGLWAYNNNVFNPSTNWGNANRNATTAHWLTQQMFTFQQFIFFRNGYDGNGNYPRVLVDWNEPMAGWDPYNNTILFGNLWAGSLVTADIVGHEYSHALTQYTCNLVYQGESGALDESIADIMGTT